MQKAEDTTLKTPRAEWKNGVNAAKISAMLSGNFLCPLFMAVCKLRAQSLRLVRFLFQHLCLRFFYNYDYSSI